MSCQIHVDVVEQKLSEAILDAQNKGVSNKRIIPVLQEMIQTLEAEDESSPLYQ